MPIRGFELLYGSVHAAAVLAEPIALEVACALVREVAKQLEHPALHAEFSWPQRSHDWRHFR